MGKQGAKTAQRYGWDRISREILTYYEQVMSDGAGADAGSDS